MISLFFDIGFVVRLISILVMAFVISSCNFVEADATQPVIGSSSKPLGEIPSIRVVFELEDFYYGENRHRESYLFDIDACKKGGLPTREISREQLGKLGTGQVELFFDARAPFVRQVTWGLDVEDKLRAEEDPSYGLCQRSLKKILTVRLDERLKPGRGGIVAVQDNSDQAAVLAKTGWHFLGDSIVAGQPCKRWRNEHHEVCVWSGGKSWGFRDGPVQMQGCYSHDPVTYFNGFPLESKLIGKGTACTVRVKSFAIGKGLLPETASPSGFGGEKPS